MMRVSISKRFDFQDDIDMEQVPEVELSRLQKQHQFMDRERKSYYEFTQNMLKNQSKLIGDLLKAKREMITNIKVAQSSHNEEKSNRSLEVLVNLLDRYDNYENEIVSLKAKIQECDIQIYRYRTKLNQRQLDPESKEEHVEVKVLQKKIKTLENRLNNASVKFNQMLCDNAKLRSEIDHLLLEQTQFDNARKKFTRKLSEDKKYITKRIDEATKAYDSRDDAQAKIQNLRERNKRETEHFNYEIKELERVINHCEKLKHFMLTKATNRSDIQHEEEKKQKKKAELRALESAPKESLDMYENILKTIKDSTGTENMDELMANYIQIEEDNFAVFNYISEINNEIELHQEEIKKIQVEIQEYKLKNKETEEEQWKRMRKIEDEIEEVTREANIKENKMIANKKNLQQIKDNLKGLMRKLSWDAPSELPDELSEVTDNNILVFMGIIEQRINKILRVDQFFRFKKQYEHPPDDMGLLGQQAATQATRTVTITIQPPPFTSDFPDEESEFEGKVVTGEEVRDQILKTLTKTSPTQDYGGRK